MSISDRAVVGQTGVVTGFASWTWEKKKGLKHKAERTEIYIEPETFNKLRAPKITDLNGFKHRLVVESANGGVKPAVPDGLA